MVYLIETGEYSDYQYHAVLTGPENIDLDAAFYDALQVLSTKTEKEIENEKRGWWGDTQAGLVAEMIRQLEQRGCKEEKTTPVHLGCYQTAELNFANARERRYK